MQPLKGAKGFQWDDGNADKNWLKHRVTRSECEQVFFHCPLVVGNAPPRAGGEIRFYALGRTDAGRRLFLVFTLRGDLIRVISARDMSDRERKAYEHGEAKSRS